MCPGQSRCKGDPVAGMALEPPVELELEQRALHLGGRRMTLPDQFVNQQRLGPEPLAHPAEHRPRSVAGGGGCAAGRAALEPGPGGAFGGGRGAAAGRRPWPRPASGPSAARTSSAVSTSVAPSRSSWLVPRWRGSSGLPGTAMTSRPCSAARRAVISEPDCGAASTTTHAEAEPGDQPVAAREVARLGHGAERPLGDHGAGLRRSAP